MTATMVRDHAADDVLVVSAAQGSKEAFAELYERHHDAALRLAKRLTRCQADADDVVAETFAAVWRAMGNGRGPRDSFRTYLLTSIRRNCGRHASGAQRAVPSDSVDDFDTAAFVSELDAAPNQDVLTEAFQSLPPRWQSVLWESEVEELPPAAIATKLGIGRRAAIALAHRARRGLGHAYLHAFAAHRAQAPCADVAPLIVESVVGELRGARLQRVESHVLECTACGDLDRELRGLKRGLRELAGPPVAMLPAMFGLGRGAVGTALSKLAVPELLAAATITAAVGVALPGEAAPLPHAADRPPASVVVAPSVGTEPVDRPVVLSAGPVVADAVDDVPADAPVGTTSPSIGFLEMGGTIGLPELLGRLGTGEGPAPATSAVEVPDVLPTGPATDLEVSDGSVGVDVTVPLVEGAEGAAIIGGMLDGDGADAHAAVSIPGLIDTAGTVAVDLPSASVSIDADAAVAAAGLDTGASVGATIGATGGSIDVAANVGELVDVTVGVELPDVAGTIASVGELVDQVLDSVRPR